MTMKVPVTTDLDTMINADDGFSEVASYTPGGGPAKNINVIFDKEFSLFEGAGVDVASSGPAAWAKSADVTGVAVNETLVIQSTTYYVTAIHPDGAGLTMLILSEDAV